MDKYTSKALSLGAKSATPFTISDIAFDPRVVIKCIFGCSDFGKQHTCPYQKSPLSMNEYKEIFSHYKRGIIIGCNNKPDSQKISYAIERQAFLDGYYFAFSLSDCGLCKTCAKAHNVDCPHPDRARPAFHAIGIDVFKTAKNLGLPLDVLVEKDDEQNWYSAVFIE